MIKSPKTPRTPKSPTSPAFRASRRTSQIVLHSVALLAVALVVVTVSLNVFWLLQSTAQASSQLDDRLDEFLNVTSSHKQVLVEQSVRTENIRIPTSEESTHKPLQKPPSAKLFSNNTSSACLLIKDDNEILNEWIAYHYHVLKLRYLVVAVDPSSETSPTSIFDTWRNETDIEILEWADPDYLPESFLKRGYHIPPKFVNRDANRSKWHEGDEDPETVVADTVRINNHRFRQVTFLAACLRHMKKEHRIWTFHVDTDEYIVVNPNLRKRSDSDDDKALEIPSVSQPSSILSVLQQVNHSAKRRRQANIPCISMPRLLFGSVEAEESSLVPTGFNAASFETLRWTHHTAYDDKERNAQPKVIADVSQVPDDDEMFKPRAFSIHRPSKQLCRRIDQLSFDAVQKYPLTVNHYVGSRERYFGRNDTRRSERSYNFKAHVNEGTDRWITSWLDGFVAEHGDDKARVLLRDHSIAGAVQK